MSSHQAVVDRVNDLIRKYDSGDFCLYESSRQNLVLAASHDALYYHNLILKFENVVFFSGPMSWQLDPEDQPVRPLRAKDARSEFRGHALAAAEVLVSIGTDEGNRVFIAAQNLSVEEGTVFYHRRDDLQPGEAIAPWVE